jgi:hypothetical protein
MQGLVESPPYSQLKPKLCASTPRLDEVIEAAEWELLNAPDLRIYPLVKQTSRGPVRAIRVEPGDATPGVVVVFALEFTGGEEKALLLDAWVIQDDDDP